MSKSDDIVKWWYSKNLLNCFRLRIVWWLPSFLGHKKIVDTKSPFSGDDGTMTPLVIRLSISDWTIAHSVAMNVLGLWELCRGIMSPFTHWLLHQTVRDAPQISWRFLKYFRASENTKINHMCSNNRHKIRFQDFVYSKFNKWMAKY